MIDDPYANDPEYQATEIESTYPPPFFPPHSKARFHPYAQGSRFSQSDPVKGRNVADIIKAPQFRTDKQVPHVQTIGWMSAPKFEELRQDDLLINVGKVSYPNYNEFSMEELAEKLNVERLKASKIAKDLFIHARSQSNPYESIYTKFNHSDAVKLANIDKLVDLFKNDQKFTFLNIGKSSGFAEYVFFKRPDAKGYGVSVENAAVLQEKDFTNVTGPLDLKDWRKLSSLYKRMLDETKSKGVDFASGLTDILDLSGDELNGEFHCKRLIILQLHGIFSVLKVGGDCILRMFDLNTKFSIDVVYILYRFFSKIVICKPYSSRACENERFIICKGLQKSSPDNILNHLLQVNNSFMQDSMTGSSIVPLKDQVRSSKSDVLSILGQDIVNKDQDFIDAVQGSNIRLVIREREALEELLRYAGKGITLGYDQLEIKNRCFQEWQIDA